MPSNQHGFQEWFNKQEILNSLKYVRPGDGFIPECTHLEKCDVNGAEAHPLFKRLKEVLPLRNTSIEEELAAPHGVQGEGRFKNVCWKPAMINDIIWNFEWFLIGPDGAPHARYHPHPDKYENPIREDLKKLLA